MKIGRLPFGWLSKKLSQSFVDRGNGFPYLLTT